MSIKNIEFPFTERFNKIVEGETKKDIAEKVGTTRQTVGNWLSGVFVPDIYALQKIAKAYNVSTDYLIGLTDKVSLNPIAVSISEQTPLDDVVIDLLLNCFDKLKLNENEKNAMNSFILALVYNIRGLSAHIENYAKMYNFTISWIKAFAHSVLDDEKEIKRITEGIEGTASYVINNSRFYLDFPKGFDVFDKIENDCIKHFPKDCIPYYWEFKWEAARLCGFSVVGTSVVIPDDFELDMYRAFKKAQEMVNYSALTNVLCYYKESNEYYFKKICDNLIRKAGD